MDCHVALLSLQVDGPCVCVCVCALWAGPLQYCVCSMCRCTVFILGACTPSVAAVASVWAHVPCQPQWCFRVHACGFVAHCAGAGLQHLFRLAFAVKKHHRPWIMFPLTPLLKGSALVSITRPSATCVHKASRKRSAQIWHHPSPAVLPQSFALPVLGKHSAQTLSVTTAAAA